MSQSQPTAPALAAPALAAPEPTASRNTVALCRDWPILCVVCSDFEREHQGDDTPTLSAASPTPFDKARVEDFINRSHSFLDVTLLPYLLNIMLCLARLTDDLELYLLDQIHANVSERMQRDTRIKYIRIIAECVILEPIPEHLYGNTETPLPIILCHRALHSLDSIRAVLNYYVLRVSMHFPHLTAGIQCEVNKALSKCKDALKFLYSLDALRSVLQSIRLHGLCKTPCSFMDARIRFCHPSGTSCGHGSHFNARVMFHALFINPCILSAQFQSRARHMIPDPASKDICEYSHSTVKSPLSFKKRTCFVHHSINVNQIIYPSQRSTSELGVCQPDCKFQPIKDKIADESCSSTDTSTRSSGSFVGNESDDTGSSCYSVADNTNVDAAAAAAASATATSTPTALSQNDVPSPLPRQCASTGRSRGGFHPYKYHRGSPVRPRAATVSPCDRRHVSREFHPTPLNRRDAVCTSAPRPVTSAPGPVHALSASPSEEVTQEMWTAPSLSQSDFPLTEADFQSLSSQSTSTPYQTPASMLHVFSRGSNFIVNVPHEQPASDEDHLPTQLFQDDIDRPFTQLFLNDTQSSDGQLTQADSNDAHVLHTQDSQVASYDDTYAAHPTLDRSATGSSANASVSDFNVSVNSFVSDEDLRWTLE